MLPLPLLLPLRRNSSRGRGGAPLEELGVNLHRPGDTTFRSIEIFTNKKVKGSTPPNVPCTKRERRMPTELGRGGNIYKQKSKGINTAECTPHETGAMDADRAWDGGGREILRI